MGEYDYMMALWSQFCPTKSCTENFGTCSPSTNASNFCGLLTAQTLTVKWFLWKALWQAFNLPQELPEKPPAASIPLLKRKSRGQGNKNKQHHNQTAENR